MNRRDSMYADYYETLELGDLEARISEREFELLPEYSTSVPTGVTVGKVWKRSLHHGHRPLDTARQEQLHERGMIDWQLGSYEECDPPKEGYCATRFRSLIVVPDEPEDE